MELDQTIDGLKALAQTTEADRFDRILTTIADFLVRHVARHTKKGQASVLMTTREAHELAFIHPPELVTGNRFPALDNSIAGRTLIGRSPIIENLVPRKAHFGFYERVPNPQGEVRAIQKMVTAPVFGADGSAIGVVEVSLTGTTPADAGPDFTDEDATRLAGLCERFGPFLRAARLHALSG